MSLLTSASLFQGLVERYDKELAARLADLRACAARTHVSALPTSASRRGLGWMDEVAAIEERLLVDSEVFRTAVKLDVLVGLARLAAEAMETAVDFAEDEARSQFGYEPEAPRPSAHSPPGTTARRPAPASSAKKRAAPKTPKSVVKSQRQRHLDVDEPPTPKMDDIGLSQTTLHLLKKRR